MTKTIDIPQNLNLEALEAFKLGNNILDNWGCNDTEKAVILGISEDMSRPLQRSQNDTSLNIEQLERISYLINIHLALSTLFSNRHNVNGFMRMVNNNEYFNGKTPLATIVNAPCKTTAIREVFRRIESLSTGL